MYPKMTEQGEYNNGYLHLTTPIGKHRAQGQEQELRPCPTCDGELLTPSALQRPRAIRKPRREQWLREKPPRKTCPYAEGGAMLYHPTGQTHKEKHGPDRKKR